MTFKMIATVAAVTMAAAANCACSAVPSTLQAQSAYGSAARAAPARPALSASSPTVEVPDGRVVGADPDLNVRFDLARNADFHLHGGGSN